MLLAEHISPHSVTLTTGRYKPRDNTSQTSIYSDYSKVNCGGWANKTAFSPFEGFGLAIFRIRITPESNYTLVCDRSDKNTLRTV